MIYWRTLWRSQFFREVLDSMAWPAVKLPWPTDPATFRREDKGATELYPGTWQSVSVYVVGRSVPCGSQNASKKIEASSSSLGDSDQVDKGTWLRAIPCLGMHSSEVPSKMSLHVSTCWCSIHF